MIKEIFQRWLGVSNSKSLSEADVLVNYFGESLNFKLGDAIKAFDENVWLNAAVNLRSEVFANVEFYMKDKNGEKVTDHPLLTLLKRPNKYITRFNMMQLVSMHLDLAGNAFWKYEMEGKTIVQIWPLLPQNVTFIMKKGEFIGGYKYNLNGVDVPFKPEEVTHFISPNPNSLLNGSAPVFSAAYAIDTEKQSNNWNYNFFKNGGSVGSILQYKGTLAKPIKERVKREFDSKHKGGDKAFKTIILDGGLELREADIKQKDMEFVQLQMTNRDKVIGVYRVPKILLAQYEGGSLAEARTAENIFAKYTMTPVIESFVETLNLDLVPMFEGTQEKGLELAFESIVDEDKEFKLQKDDAALNKWMTVNERREQEGLKPVVGGDVIYQPLSQVPIDYASSYEVQGGDDTNKTEEDATKEYTRKRTQKLLKKNSTAFKKEYSKKFLINHSLQETRFIKKLKKAFADQKREALEKLQVNKNYARTKSLADDIFVESEEAKKFAEIFAPFIYEIAKENANEVNMFFGLGVQSIESIPNLDKAVQKMTFKFAQEVNATTANLLKEQLAEGLAAGESIDKIATRVRGVFTEAQQSRAVMIARTETTKASTLGALETYKASDVVNGKMWLTTIDDRTRGDHEYADGQTVKLEEKFDVGGEELEGPGTGNDPGNNINCRCTPLPVIL